MLSSSERAILQLEKNYWQAIKENDFERALGLTDDPCIVAGAQGVSVIDRQAFREMIKSSNWTLEDYEFTGDPVVRMINDDVGVVAYTIHQKMNVDDEPVSFDASQASTWRRKADRWVCSMHVESRAENGSASNK